MTRLKCKSVVGLVLVAWILCACTTPTSDQVASDFAEVFSRDAGAGLEQQIVSTGAGEGDADHVYQHVQFDVRVKTDEARQSGWFAGVALRKGQQLRGGELEMRYSRSEESTWKLNGYKLIRRPSDSAIDNQ